MVGTTGFEPATSSVSRKRSNQLSYAPRLQQLIVYQEQGCGESRAKLTHVHDKRRRSLRLDEFDAKSVDCLFAN